MPAAKQYVVLHDLTIEDEKVWKFAPGDIYDGPPDRIEGLLTNKYDVNKGPLIAEKASDEAKQAQADAAPEGN